MKFLSRSSIAIASSVALASLVGFAGNVNAQTTGQSEVKVKVPSVFSLTDADPAVDFGELANDATSGLSKTDTITVRSNSKTGFIVTVTSVNGAKLKDQDASSTDGDVSAAAATETIGYTLDSSSSLTGSKTGVTPSTGTAAAQANEQLFESNSWNNGAKCASGCDITVTVKLEQGDLAAAPAATYTDTIYYGLYAR